MAETSSAIRSSIATYQSIVAYDGTHFRGFQRQREDDRTVQGVLEDALRVVGWNGRSLKAAGRTDTGVHAEGQVITYNMTWAHSVEDLNAALNANLPEDVAVRASKAVEASFHPRFDAVSRTYRYLIFVDRLRNPLKERYAWRLSEHPDMDKLSAAARLFLGEHDFAAYGRPPREGASTIRDVRSCHWTFEDDMLEFHMEANAFLYHMVRHVTAAIVDVGLGYASLSELRSMLEDPSRRREGRLAPAGGLCLVRVTYPDGPRNG
ncbi:MAG: tRNA pseudouridine(38-40) synthase TruA [Anaerolineales bacterium]|jgi:tRNA pseudouridine38-40 synthase